ncbi:DUF3536 domain-containing protein [Candidatus Aerophobetes bacterium]|nr:DUF3536 domain-containing protein [Candidatus Aerophobetes bacterium]
MSEEKKASGYVIVHGHFYQPPREDPWIEEVEKQKEAKPYHDWNELISYQCYLPNACARVVDDKGKIVDLVNNYSYISFNFGPTLLSWMEKKFPRVVDFLYRADKESAKKNNGHGNAICQVYNHMIMPLASEKDKYTQAKWGIKYFEKKFGRFPEAIWLPETAVNDATVKVLIDVGMKFIILAPHQAQRIRPLEKKNEDVWQDVSDGTIDTSIPYRLFLKDEKGQRIEDTFIDVFFYQGELSRAIAFERILKNSSACADKIEKIIKDKKTPPFLVNIATDGETYGHHEPFSDMCLAHLLKYELPERGIQVVNYAHYLEINPPAYEVELKAGENGEGTSWSCAHGVGRWKKNCGCSSGAHPEWNQNWRAPLRESLDWLRDRLASLFENEGKELFQDTWQARDNYIDVIVERSPESMNNFLQAHLKVEATQENKVKALKLLEMQRFSMLMYTSCGWFFDELSGVETVQNLKYAARAMQLAEELAGEDLEGEFSNRLSEAKSNVKEFGDGKGVYEKLIKPSVADWQKFFAHFLICEELVEEKSAISPYEHDFETFQVRQEEISGILLKVGRGKLTSRKTQELKEGTFFLTHFGGHKIYCFIAESVSDEDYTNLQEKLLFKDIDLSLEGLKSLASPFFGSPFTLKDLFAEDREKILSFIMSDKIKEIREVNESLFDRDIELVREFVRMGWQMSFDFTFLTSNVLNYRINQQIDEFEQDEDFEHFEKVKNSKKIAHELDLDLDISFAAKVVERFVLSKMEVLSQEFNLDVLKMLHGLNQYMSSLNIHYRRYDAQNELWEIMQQKILPQLDSMSQDKENLDFLQHFFVLAEDFNFKVPKRG